jgi:hypothetical protein
MLSPAVLYSQGENKIFVEDGAEFIRYVSRTRPYTYRFDQTGIWPRFYSGELDVAQCHPHPHLRDVLGIVGSADKSFVLPELKLRFKEIVHSFVGSGVSVRLIEVEGAGHNASDLLTGEALVALRSLLRNQ